MIFKKFAKFTFVALTVALFTACGAEGKNDTKSENVKPNDKCQLSIRYIDKDSLLRNYNLAKDLNEAMLRSSEKLDAAQRQKSAEIQRLAADIQNKYKSNGYLTEASFNADQQKLQKMQMDAENYMASLQRTIQNEMLQNNVQLNDSVENFIKEYNKDKKYDVILDKAATFHIDAKYDITKDIITGLNARYNKVESKK